MAARLNTEKWSFNNFSPLLASRAISRRSLSPSRDVYENGIRYTVINGETAVVVSAKGCKLYRDWL